MIVSCLQIVSAVVVGTLLHCWLKLSGEEGQNILRELLVIFYSPVVNIESEAKQLGKMLSTPVHIYMIACGKRE